jgi:hypothetical protein
LSNAANAKEALALSREAGPKLRFAEALYLSGEVALNQSDDTLVHSRAEESVVLYQQRRSNTATAFGLSKNDGDIGPDALFHLLYQGDRNRSSAAGDHYEQRKMLMHNVNSPGTDLDLAQRIVTTYNNSSNYQSIFEDCMEKLQGGQRESGTSYSPHWNCAKRALYRREPPW